MHNSLAWPQRERAEKFYLLMSLGTLWCLFNDILAYSTLYLNRHVCDDLILNVHHVNVCMLRATTNVLSAADMYHNYGQ